MVKIKDNVPIEELEKYGFKVTEVFEGMPTLLENKDTHIELYDDIYDKWNTRIVYALGSAYLDTIYDLIQAGLVEKVSED